jgi:hypothetical protein
MSIGLPWDQVGGRTSFSLAMVLSASWASGMRRSAARSAAMTPGPPPLVMMARWLPRGRKWENSALAAANSWPRLYRRITPARRRAASNTASSPTCAPECRWAAREPTGWRPTLISSTGLTRAAARSALTKRRASLMPSTYRKMLSVRESDTMYSRASPKSTSTEVPRETTEEKPTLLGRAQSRMAEQRAPDWEIRPMEPLMAPPRAKLALSPSSGRSTPRQLGPSRRMRWRRAFSTVFFSSILPRGPASAKPDGITTAALVPARPQASTMAGTRSALVVMTTRSRRWGMSSTLL